MLPPLGKAGLPVRFTAMMFVALAAMVAIGFRWLMDQWPCSFKLRTAAGMITVGLIVLNFLPGPMNYVEFDRPDDFFKVIEEIRTEEGDFNILNAPMIGNTIALYYQTLHERPLAMGYISRTPRAYIDKMQPAPGIGFITRMREQSEADDDLARFEEILTELNVRYIFNYDERNDAYLRGCGFLELIYTDPLFEAFRVRKE
jgi:hypothetical protein